MGLSKRETVDDGNSNREAKQQGQGQQNNHHQQQGSEKTYPIDVKHSTYKKLGYKAKERGLSLRQYVNDLLYLLVKKGDFIKKYCPGIYLDTTGSNSLYLKDYRQADGTKSKTAEISIRDNKVHCSLDESNDCIHIHFAYCLPEISVLLREHEQQQEIEEQEEENEEEYNRTKKTIRIAASSFISVALGGVAVSSMMHLSTISTTNLMHHAFGLLTHLVYR